MTYSVFGRAHRLLDALSDGDLPGHLLLRHLEEKGYVRIIQDRDGDMVQITVDGWDARMRLDDGEEVE